MPEKPWLNENETASARNMYTDHVIFTSSREVVDETGDDDDGDGSLLYRRYVNDRLRNIKTKVTTINWSTIV